MRLIPSDPDIATVVSRIRDGSLDLQPAFQRGEVWSRPKQRLLIDSVLRNWYVPPIHVIRTDDESQEVLDGQQRLRAIFDFVSGRFRVQGNAEPQAQAILALDGLDYESLPDPVRRRFDRFTLRLFELVDYNPEEPFELFFRLNQPTTLTSAEKRNAFFGPARDQVRELTRKAEDVGMRSDRIGFSNVRLAYEDIIARFVWTLEIGTLREKLTAAKITDRYREENGFSSEVLRWADNSLVHLFGCHSLDEPDVRLNKATAHSWLCFAARQVLLGSTSSQDFNDFLGRVESRRSALRRGTSPLMESGDAWSRLLPILNDRSTARVNDVTSVLLRDVILWVLYSTENKTPLPSDLHTISETALSPIADYRAEPEAVVLKAIDEVRWGNLV